MRAGPRASLSCVDRAWGSHFTHSHSSRFFSEQKTATRIACGELRVVTCIVMARTWACVASAGPATSMWLKSPSMTPSGSSSTIEWASMKRRMAERQTTSGLASGGSSGSTSCIASSWDEEPNRTCVTISLSVLRSHRRVPSWAIRTRESGEGSCQPT